MLPEELNGSIAFPVPNAIAHAGSNQGIRPAAPISTPIGT